jgi:hypothetical protein
MHFGWVKGHAGIEGNELVDSLAKEAAVADGMVLYDKIPRDGHHKAREGKWTSYVATAVDEYRERSSDQSFFPSVRNRLRQKIPTFLEFRKLVTGHGKLKLYLHRFGLTDNLMSQCEEEQQQQTTDNSICRYKK